VGWLQALDRDLPVAIYDAKLEFDVTLIAYEGNDNWVEQAIKAYKCLNGDSVPEAGVDCGDYCAYRKVVKEIEK
jgi:hypothetical protein